LKEASQAEGFAMGRQIMAELARRLGYRQCPDLGDTSGRASDSEEFVIRTGCGLEIVGLRRLGQVKGRNWQRAQMAPQKKG
jgi:hypothetical protein